MTAVGVLAVVSRVDFATFWLCAVVVVVGAVGVVVARHPVHAALMLVMTLFGVAVLFIAQQANFLAAVQVIVYAGAIVVLFLFVIMFLGVDRQEDVNREPLRGQRIIAPLLVALALAGVLLLGSEAHWAIGPRSVVGPARGQPGGDVAALGRSVFTVYLFAFEITAALLVVAVVGAVVLARRPRPGPEDTGLPEADAVTVADGDGPAAQAPDAGAGGSPPLDAAATTDARPALAGTGPEAGTGAEAAAGPEPGTVAR